METVHRPARRTRIPPGHGRGLGSAAHSPVPLLHSFLLIAALWSIYCVSAPLHKESRYRKRYGARFEDYRKRVPYFLPRLRNLNLRTTR